MLYADSASTFFYFILLAHNEACPKRIGLLYKIEELIRDKTPEERYQERQKQSKPLVDALFEWLHSLETDNLDRKSLIGDAILYTLGKEEYLRRYLDDGHLQIDNNSCEANIKPYATARKAWLFADTPKGARANAVLYTLAESARANELDVYEYLKYLLTEMPGNSHLEHPEIIDKYLPW